MTIRVSGKHMEIGESFRTKIETFVEGAVSKYFDGGYSSQVTVEKSGSRFTTDCKVHLDTGVVLQATGEAQDPIVSFDAAGTRVEKRLRRYKRRLKDHHASAKQHKISYSVMDSIAEEEEVQENYAPTIVAESSKVIHTMSVATAVMALDMTDDPLVVFRSPGNDEVNVVYRRQDGNIGWVDASNVK